MTISKKLLSKKKKRLSLLYAIILYYFFFLLSNQHLFCTFLYSVCTNHYPQTTMQNFTIHSTIYSMLMLIDRNQNHSWPWKKWIVKTKSGSHFSHKRMWSIIVSGSLKKHGGRSSYHQNTQSYAQSSLESSPDGEFEHNKRLLLIHSNSAFVFFGLLGDKLLYLLFFLCLSVSPFFATKKAKHFLFIIFCIK